MSSADLVMIKFGIWILNIGFHLCVSTAQTEKSSFISQRFFWTNKKFNLINYQRNPIKNKSKQIFNIQTSADEMPKLLNRVVMQEIILYCCNKITNKNLINSNSFKIKKPSSVNTKKKEIVFRFTTTDLSNFDKWWSHAHILLLL